MINVLDDIAPAFRTAKDRWPDAPNMLAHYNDLVRTFESNGSSLVELCKSFLEMVCITVVKELNGTLPTSSTPSTTELLGSALDTLGLRAKRGSSELGTIISGHNKLAKGLANLRNKEGSVGHGKDGFIDAMSDRHARVYLLSADAIISLIIQAYEGVEPSILKTREPHDRFYQQNKKIDGVTQVESHIDEDGALELFFRYGSLEDGFKIRVSASELLFYLDRQAYINVLDALRGVATEIEGEGEIELEHAEQPEEPAIEILSEEETTIQPTTETRRIELITEYRGKFADKVTSLYEYIVYSILSGDEKDAKQVQNLTYTLLNGMEDLAVVDWSKRDSSRSKVRLFAKKLVKLFSIRGFEADSIDQIVEWMANCIDGGD